MKGPQRDLVAVESGLTEYTQRVIQGGTALLSGVEHRRRYFRPEGDPSVGPRCRQSLLAGGPLITVESASPAALDHDQHRVMQTFLR